MSIDNIMAIAGASKGNMFLLLFGLGSSIPLVVDKHDVVCINGKIPIIIYIGANRSWQSSRGIDHR